MAKMDSSTRLAEQRLKLSVLNFLTETGQLKPDSVLMNELSFRSRALRADLAVLTEDTLLGFELKSRRDNLRRLPQQIDLYQRTFDATTVVVDSVHIKRAKQLVPKRIGLWEFDNGVIRIIRTPHIGQLNKKELVPLLSIAALRSLGSANALKSTTSRRSELESRAIRLPYIRLRKEYETQLRSRFEKSSKDFMSKWFNTDRESADLTLLSRFSRKRKAAAHTAANVSTQYQAWFGQKRLTQDAGS